MSISDSTVDQFLAIAGDGCSSDDASKYLQMGKGSIEIALNYFYNKREKTLKRDSDVSNANSNAFSRLREGSKRQAQLEKVIKEVRKNYYQPVAPSQTKDETVPLMPDDLLVSTDVSASLERIRQDLKNSRFAQEFPDEGKAATHQLPSDLAASNSKSLNFGDLQNYADTTPVKQPIILEDDAAGDVESTPIATPCSSVNKEPGLVQETPNNTLSGKKTAFSNAESIDDDPPSMQPETLNCQSAEMRIEPSLKTVQAENDITKSNDEGAAKKSSSSWFTQPKKRSYFEFEQQRSSELHSKLEDAGEWPRYLGSMIIKAFVIGSLSHKVHQGDPVFLSREKQNLTLAKKTSKKEQKKNASASVIRVVHNDEEIGKLENNYAVMLGSLLDKNYVFLDCTLLSPPSDWNYFSPFSVTAKVYLAQEVISKPITKVFSTKETLKGQEELLLGKLEATREAFSDLFEALRLNRITDTLIQRQQPKKFDPSNGTSKAGSGASAPRIKMSELSSTNGMEIEPESSSRTIDSSASGKIPAKQSVTDLFDPFRRVPKQTSLQVFKKAPPNPSDQPNSTNKHSGADSEEGKQIAQNESNDVDYAKLLNLENPNQEELKLTDPPETFTSSLHGYQKQALTWMLTREGQLDNMYNAFNANSRNLHALWEEYLLSDNTSLYFNPYTGQLSIILPQASPECKGGILADEMGLGKTVMMIALVHSHRPAHRQSNACLSLMKGPGKKQDENDGAEQKATMEAPKKLKLNNGTIAKSESKRKRGGTLIVLPLSLLAQWEGEFEVHSQYNTISTCLYYGNMRGGDLSMYDIVLTTYGIVSTEFTSNSKELYQYDWFRIVLDEAHYIKGRTIHIAKAVYELNATHKWCLTGTPIQNKLDDMFSLIHFLKLEPWSDYVWWNNYINKPNERSDPVVFKILQTILKPILLRRTKRSQQSNGELLIELPERKQRTEYVDLSKEERDIYDALFRKSKTEFDQYVSEGTVMSNYVHVFEILLRLRQVCDHPFLIFTRKDVQAKDQMDEAINKFLKRYDTTANESIYPKNPLQKLDLHDHYEIEIDEQTHEEKRIEVKRSAKAANPEFLKEQIERLKKGEGMESCPVCLSNVDDAVITVCAHVSCRECLIRAIETSSMCPVCRHSLTKRDYMTVPRDNRFSVDMDQKYTRSSKIHALSEHIKEVIALQEKCVIFSQWVSMLDLIEYDLKKSNVSFVRLDGSMSQKKRAETLQRFKKEEKLPVFLVSLKAGGVGLNLTMANHVFLIDPWWNPAVEDQAVERVHRIGQKKNVEIIRFICRHTVEERIIELHVHKKELFDSTISRNQEEKKAHNIENFKYLMKNYS